MYARRLDVYIFINVDEVVHAGYTQMNRHRITRENRTGRKKE